MNRSIEATLSPVVPKSSQPEVIKEMSLLHNDQIRKLVPDLPLDQLRTIEPELLEKFPALVDVSINATHSYCGDLGFGECPVGVGDLQRTFVD